MGKITSRDIAKLAGVSVSTVSLVLNNKPGVGEETRSRIQKILTAHGIVPRSGIAAGREVIRFCKIIRHGGILNDRHTGFISEYIDGVVEEAAQYGMSVEVATYEQNDIHEVMQEIEDATGPFGAILLSTELSEEEVSLFSSLKSPHVFLDANYPFAKGSFVTMDNEAMVFEAVRFLAASGHRTIGMFAAAGCSNFAAREKAFKDSQERLSLNLDESSLLSIRSTHQGSYEDVSLFLENGGKDSLPTSFFACNDTVASGAIRALHEKGFRVPDDISVIGFDDLPVSSLLTPPLTTLSVPKLEMGRVAVRVLLNEWHTDSHVPSQKNLLGGTLIHRSSVKKLS